MGEVTGFVHLSFCVTALLCGHVCVCVFQCVHLAHWEHQKEVKLNGGVRGWCVCVSAPT